MSQMMEAQNATTKRKRIPQKELECPHCGNPTLVRAVPESQKCKYCRRLIKAHTQGFGKKRRWELEPVDFEDGFRDRDLPFY